MSKAEGKKIGIKFTLPLVGDVSGNENAFTVTGQEYLYTDGPNHNGILVNKNYEVENVERYGTPPLWNIEESLQLGYSDIPISVSYGNDVTGEGTQIAYNVFGAGYEIYRAFDKNNNTLWYASGTIDRWLGIDYGSNPQIIGKFTVLINPSRFKGYVFESSNDNTNWTPLSTGDFANITTLQTITFNNDIAYRYYRLRCTSVYTGSNVGVNELEMFPLVPVYGYEREKIHNETPIQITGQYRVRWLEDKPANTDITIEYTTGTEQGQWLEVSNGDVINSDTNLWFRVTLETTDTSVSPILQDLWIEDSDGPQDSIRLVMSDGFKNIQGNMTILYNQSLGNLAGTGGVIESFEEIFTPIDLEEGLTDSGGAYGTHEYISVSSSGSIELLYITKIPTYNTEYIQASVSGIIELIHIDNINP